MGNGVSVFSERMVIAEALTPVGRITIALATLFSYNVKLIYAGPAENQLIYAVHLLKHYHKYMKTHIHL